MPHHITIDHAREVSSQVSITSTQTPIRWTSIATKWPRVGGRDFEPPPRDAFLSDEFGRRFQPGENRVIYVATSAGARRLAEEIKIPTSKISTCGAGRLVERLKEQSIDAYGAARMQGGELTFDAGWNAWDAVLLQSETGPCPSSPVSLTPRAIVVTMPATMDAKAFDDLFDAETRKAALHLWADTLEGARHFQRIGVDPSVVKRHTRYRFDTGSRVSEAREICAYRQSQDADRLIAVAEAIILRSLGLST